VSSGRISFIHPQIPTLAKVPPTGDHWIHQPKLDGFRCIAVKNGAMVRLFSRRGVEFRLPGMAAVLANLAAETAVLDTELICVRADGRADFFALLRQRPCSGHQR
jgi:bifunctional non-homologous end joining protein LigD